MVSSTPARTPTSRCSTTACSTATASSKDSASTRGASFGWTAHLDRLVGVGARDRPAPSVAARGARRRGPRDRRGEPPGERLHPARRHPRRRSARPRPAHLRTPARHHHRHRPRDLPAGALRRRDSRRDRRDPASTGRERRPAHQVAQLSEERPGAPRGASRRRRRSVDAERGGLRRRVHRRQRVHRRRRSPGDAAGQRRRARRHHPRRDRRARRRRRPALSRGATRALRPLQSPTSASSPARARRSCP